MAVTNNCAKTSRRFANVKVSLSKCMAQYVVGNHFCLAKLPRHLHGEVCVSCPKRAVGWAFPMSFAGAHRHGHNSLPHIFPLSFPSFISLPGALVRPHLFCANVDYYPLLPADGRANFVVVGAPLAVGKTAGKTHPIASPGCGGHCHQPPVNV